MWLVVAALVTAGFVRVFARWERGGRRPAGVARAGAAPSMSRIARVAGVRIPVAIAVLSGILGVGVVLVLGFGAWIALAALGLLGVALRGSRGSRGSRERAETGCRDSSRNPPRDTRSAPAAMSVGGGSMEPQHNM